MSTASSWITLHALGTLSTNIVCEMMGNEE
jgi:hypothetical protein